MYSICNILDNSYKLAGGIYVFENYLLIKQTEKPTPGAMVYLKNESA